MEASGGRVIDPENPAFSGSPTPPNKRIFAQNLTGWRAKAMDRNQAVDILANAANNLAATNASETAPPLGTILQARWAVFQAGRLSALTPREELFNLVRARHPDVSSQWLNFLEKDTVAREGQILPDFRYMEPEITFVTLEQVKESEARTLAYLAFSFQGDDFQGRWPAAFLNPDRIKLGNNGEKVQVTGPDGKPLPGLVLGGDSAQSTRNLSAWLENNRVKPFYFLFATSQLTTNSEVKKIAEKLLKGYTITH